MALDFEIKTLINGICNLETTTLKEILEAVYKQFPNNLEITHQRPELVEEIRAAIQSRVGELGEKSNQAPGKENSQSLSAWSSRESDQVAKDREFALLLATQPEKRRPVRKAAMAKSQKRRHNKSSAGRDTHTAATAAAAAAAAATCGTNIRKSGNNFPTLRTSDELGRFLDGMEKTTPSQAVKKVWDYIKEANLQDPIDRRYILIDDKLGQFIKGTRVHMFHITKYIHRHLYKEAE